MTTRTADRAVLDVHVGELKQLFNEMDPSPFRDRDLDPNAEECIVDWAREAPADAPLALTARLGREPATSEAAAVLQQAATTYFGARAHSTCRRLRQLLRIGRVSLVIGLAFLAGAVMLGDVLAGLFANEDYGEVVQEGLIIGGWVAMWRPLGIFLYDWWPIRAEARLYGRLSAMTVRVVGGARGAADQG